MKSVQLLRTLWHDPVWSKVIAGGILAFVGLIATWWISSRNSDGTVASSVVQSDAELEQRNLTFVAFANCDNTQDLRKRYEIARDIASQSSRETTIAVLVADATCARDEAYALELYAKLTVVWEKDWAARAAAARHLRARRLDDAKKWSAMLSDSRDRDWWLNRILAVSP